MGGGNGQKSATARARNQAKEDAAKKGGGGQAGFASRTGDPRDAMAAAAAERERVKAAREAKKGKK